jgi:ClpP class serine protease
VNDVAKFRGVSVERALAMADGKVFIGRQAQQAGLVDDRFTLDNLVGELSGVLRMARVAHGVRMAIEERIRGMKREKPPGFNDKGRSPQRTFYQLVCECQEKRNMNLKEAVLTVAKENPEAYLRRLWGTEHLNP